MYGQLVIFSDNNFQDTIYIGVIRESDRPQMVAELAATGALTLKIELLASEENVNYGEVNEENPGNDSNQSSEAFANLKGKNLTMIESKVYFEAYSHVLKSLQTVR
mmetsp:Transcript_5831/g.9334  ORF Transcript_5831/g.9334 Transcript_5831/m.9334 type:complete len:106 (+) Transcript_5831:1213-1530(+)